MSEPTNAEILQHVFDSLFHVISQNTTPSFAWLTLRIVMQKTCYNHQFLHQVDLGEIETVHPLNIHDPLFSTTSITKVDPEINSIPTQEIGHCIHDMIHELHHNMDPQAGYVLLHQFRIDLGEDMFQEIQNIGVNLRLTEIQDELYGWKEEELIK